MPITNRTRKILWGKSGNRCAICKKKLVVDATAHDNESVVGDECHIISSSSNGPRYDRSYPTEQMDSFDNLILLCRTHHKMIDDQTATYTQDLLLQIKYNHQQWVSEKLGEQNGSKPIRIRRVKENTPSFLHRLTTGGEVLNLVTNVMAYNFDHDELKNPPEVELVSDFLQTVQDWGEVSGNLNAGNRVKTSFSLTESLAQIEKSGFYVFGAREVSLLEGGKWSHQIGP